MNVADVIEVMDEWAPPSLAYSWDKAGLATGSPDDRVTKVLVCLTVTREAFAAAKRAKAQMIVSHHPLIWDPLTTLRRDDACAALCMDIAAAGIACYSAHTNLDVVRFGVNWALAAMLGAGPDPSPLFPVPQAEMWKLVTFVPDTHLAKVRDAVCELGEAGGIGKYTHCTFSVPGTGTFMPGPDAQPFTGAKLKLNEEPERRFETIFPKHALSRVLKALRKAHPYEEIAYDLVKLENGDPAVSLGVRYALQKPVPLGVYAEHVRKRLKVKHVRMVGDPNRKIRNVAVMGGAGGSSAADLPDDVDVFVTGDVKYHEALDAGERGIAIIDAGHHGTELPVLRFIVSRLEAMLPKLRVAEYREPDPFKAVTGK